LQEKTPVVSAIERIVDTISPPFLELTEQPQPDTIFFILRVLSNISRPVLM